MFFLLKLVLGIVIGLIALAAIGFVALSIIFPPFSSLAFKTISSFFASPSSNNTFTSGVLNFSYPQNWIEINPSSITSSFAKTLNATTLQNVSDMQILIPASSMFSLMREGPSLISSISSKNINLSKLASTLLSNTNIILVGSVNLSKLNASSHYNISVKSNLTSSASSLYKLINVSNNSKVNLSFVEVDGKPAFTATFNNLTYKGIIRVPYGGLAGIIDGSHLCFVLAVAGNKVDIPQTMVAFDRVYKSTKC
ncbi:hypothetical protein IHE50_00505 [Candidatus Parvarchaeota archaeon]|jgi:hypothetical protein|uniref:Uncharacterized protein n=1 Tax=Candidatus Acidifodinimicrobium mancum TaxID=2898728 RepID=A0A8T3UWQ3_9ARCH|nr:hypothetical protein [Candidatus Acidifodinimicrobium mancum]